MGRRSDINWKQIKADWDTGKFSINTLGKMHGVSKGSISGKIRSEGWVKNETIEQQSNRTIKAAKEIADVIEQNSTLEIEHQKAIGKVVDLAMEQEGFLMDQRKLARAFHNVIGKAFKDGLIDLGNMEKAAQTMRTLTDALIPRQMQVAVQNNMQSENQAPQSTTIEIVGVAPDVAQS